MTIREIAEQYLEGLRLREQARQFSQRMLAQKFECSRRVIGQVANRMPCNLPEDEKRLILSCIAERDRLKSRAAELSMPRLCQVHGVAHQTIENELIRMGEREVAA
tara:strand:+ start:766 stop:1083 length:318 start_codon:yes stop_codon:yes gene_type:complete